MQARVLDICPFVNVRVKTRLLLFRPRVGANLGVRPSQRSKQPPSANPAMCAALLCSAPARMPARRNYTLVFRWTDAALCVSAVGRVNLVGADHVGLLVYNMFNVAIGRENIRQDLRFVDTVRVMCTLLHPGCWR